MCSTWHALTRPTGARGAVDEVTAVLDEDLELPLALVARGAKAPVLAEGHRAERELGHPQAALAEKFLSHAPPSGLARAAFPVKSADAPPRSGLGEQVGGEPADPQQMAGRAERRARQLAEVAHRVRQRSVLTLAPKIPIQTS